MFTWVRGLVLDAPHHCTDAWLPLGSMSLQPVCNHEHTSGAPGVHKKKVQRTKSAQKICVIESSQTHLHIFFCRLGALHQLLNSKTVPRLLGGVWLRFIRWLHACTHGCLCGRPAHTHNPLPPPSPNSLFCKTPLLGLPLCNAPRS